MTMGDLSQLTAVQAAEGIRAGYFSSEAVVGAFLERIVETDETICAWASLDPEHALEQARERDRSRLAGRATGALHGVPVGLKDIIDTADMPTQRGTSIFAGRMAHADARMVERLREAGAVIMGKTRTTELAYIHPSITTNPHDPSRTPGGSSSGSAAAVAARHVPLAVGTQTGGSVIRPASFCGTYGFKPTRGVISRTGVFRTSASLDQVGVFANTLEDVALLTEVLGCYDQADEASFARARPDVVRGARAEAPVEPDIAWFDLPHHDRLDKDAVEGLEQLIEALGGSVERFTASPQLANLTDVHKLIYDYELNKNLALIEADYSDNISAELLQALANGRNISDAQYAEALEIKASAETFFANHFTDFDAIMGPSATGEALPLSAGSTGDAVYCTTWTLAGLPCLTVPLLVGENGLPIGVQFVGAIEEDDRLLRTVAWVQGALANAAIEGD